eukprot:scaffold257185_cov34-Prasinocladus_malaysianus.AAC.1
MAQEFSGHAVAVQNATRALAALAASARHGNKWPRARYFVSMWHCQIANNTHQTVCLGYVSCFQT